MRQSLSRALELSLNIRTSPLGKIFARAKSWGLKNGPSWLFGGGGSSTAGEPVTEQTVMAISAAYGCVKVISEAVASLPCEIFERLQPRGRKLAFSRPEHYLLHNEPSTEMTAYIFWQVLMVHVLLRGNGYARIIRNGNGYPIELKFYESWDVGVYKLADGSTYYRLPDVGVVLPGDMLHIKGLGFDGICGKSVLSWHADTFGNGLAATKMQGRFFKDGTATGAGWYETPDGVNTEKAREASNMIRERYSGSNRFNAMVLPYGVKFHSVAISQSDAQYIETMGFHVEEVARIFNVPLHKVKSMKAATRANMEQQNIEFVTDTLRPWIKNIEQELDRKLFGPRSPFFSKFNLDALKRGDILTQTQHIVSMIYSGVLSVNEARDMLNRNPREGGDEYLQANNTYNMDQLLSQIEKTKAETEKLLAEANKEE